VKQMKNRIFSILLNSAMCFVLFGCSGETAKKTASKVTKKAVEMTKGTLTGIEKGIEDGRKAAESTDGALIITNAEDLNNNVSISFVSVCPNDLDQSLTLDIGFENNSDKPVRIVNLHDKGNLLFLDKEGFAYELNHGPSELTVPPKAKVKLPFSFKGKVNSLNKVRIYGKEFNVPTDIEKKEVPNKTEDAKDNTQI